MAKFLCPHICAKVQTLTPSCTVSRGTPHFSVQLCSLLVMLFCSSSEKSAVRSGQAPRIMPRGWGSSRPTACCALPKAHCHQPAMPIMGSPGLGLLGFPLCWQICGQALSSQFSLYTMKYWSLFLLYCHLYHIFLEAGSEIFH